MTNLRDLVRNIKFRLDIVFRRCWKQPEGQDFVKYALLAGFVALAARATLDPMGDSVERIFEHVRSVLRVARRA